MIKRSHGERLREQLRLNPGFSLEIPLLRTFVAVASAGSFSGAALHLRSSQPSISIQIKRLETRLGTVLFERRNQGCQLTEAGKVLLDHATETLRAHDAVLTRLKTPSFGGLIRIGILDETDPNRTSEILRCLVKVCPRTNLEVSVKASAELVTDYRRGRLDLIFAAAPTISEDALSVWREEIVWAGAETMRRTEGPVPLVALRDPCAYRSAALAALTSARRPWVLVCTSSTMKGVRAAVEAGIGVTVMERRSVGAPLKRLGLDWSLPRVNDVFISAFCANPRFTGVVSVLREMLSGDHGRNAIRPGG